MYGELKNMAGILRSGGWFPGRAIDIRSYVDVCESEGYEVNLFAREFMTCYGGLTLTHSSYAGDEDDYSIFDPKIAIATVFYERTESYRKLSINNERLCPVGVGFSEHLVYFVGESGKIYGGFDDYFCLIGTDLSDAFCNIFDRHSFLDLSCSERTQL